MADYKHTNQSAQTDFPMKADLAQREPAMVRAWEERGTYAKLRELAPRPAALRAARRAAVRQRRHSHRHAVNKILKDIVVKSRSLDGFDSPYIPRWGLPRDADRAAGGEKARPPRPEARRAGLSCRLPRLCARADRSAAADFKRLGVLGTGTDLPHHVGRATRRSSCALSAASSVTDTSTGREPVHWCLDSARRSRRPRVEYEEKTSPAIDVAFRVSDARIGGAHWPHAAQLGHGAVDVVTGPPRRGRCRRIRPSPWGGVPLRARAAGTGAERRRGLIVAAELCNRPSSASPGGAAVLAQFRARARGTEAAAPLPGPAGAGGSRRALTLDAGTGRGKPPPGTVTRFRRRATATACR